MATQTPPSVEADASRRRTPRRVAARVLFEDDGSGWAHVAALLFARMTHPALAQAASHTSAAPQRKDALQRLVESAASGATREASRSFDPPDGKEASLVIRLLSSGTPSSEKQMESWVLPTAAGDDGLRITLEWLRRRVWKLVAREGWYRLQPAAALRT